MFLLFLNQFIPDSVVKAFSWTLIHSLWQGLAAAVIAGIIIACTRKSAAALRYNLLASTLFLFVIISFCTFITELKKNTKVERSETVVERIFSPSNPDGGTEQTNIIDLAKSDPLTICINYFNEHAPLVVLVWFIFFLAKFFQLFAGLRYIHRLRTKNNIEVEDDWKQRLTELAAQTGIRQSLIFLQSELIKIPVVIGVLKPAILVPIGIFAQLPAEQVEAILLHELAHIKRKDFLVNLIQSFTEVIFFFNPAITWISSLLREEREACCDDIVVKIMPRKKSYLEALVSFQDYSAGSSVHAMAFGGRKNYLLHRVRRMLTQENKKLNVMEKTVLVLGLIGIMAFSFITVKEKKPAQTKTVASRFAAVKQALTTTVETKRLPQTKPLLTTKPASNNHFVAADTVPEKKMRMREPSDMSFPNLSSNTSDDGNTRRTLIQATDNNGKKYNIQKQNGEVTDFSVDGKKIPTEDYSKYDNVFDNIDRTMRSNSLQAEKRRTEDYQRKSEEMRQRLSEMANTQAKLRERQERLSEKHLQEQSQRMEERMSEQRHKMEKQQRSLMDQKVRLDSVRMRQPKEKLFRESNSLKVKNSQNEIHSIISDLAGANLIGDKQNLSFTLNNNELVVNGKKASSEIHQQLKEKYIRKSGDSFKYSREGNSESTTINKE
jgi:bla regulator protein BlaR1